MRTSEQPCSIADLEGSGRWADLAPPLPSGTHSRILRTVSPAVATNLTRKVGETSSNSRKDTGNRERQDRVALTMFHETDAHEPEKCCRLLEGSIRIKPTLSRAYFGPGGDVWPKSVLLGGLPTQFTSQAPSTVMNTTDPSEVHA